MKKNYRKEIEKLDLFLADTEGESTEAVVEELRKEGSDIEKYLSEIDSIVRKGYQEALKQIAATERAEVVRQRESRFAGLVTTKDQMLRLIIRIQNGEFGVNLQQRAIARCRNQDQLQVSEEDLRSWLEDIDASELCER